MKRFVQGENRTQGTLLPELLDDYIAENNPVRVIDVFVDELDLGQLGFDGVAPALTGRPRITPQFFSRFTSMVISIASSPVVVWSGKPNATSG